MLSPGKLVGELEGRVTPGDGHEARARAGEDTCPAYP